MAYNTRFYFEFRSTNGTDYAIHIKEDGFTGAAVKRPLGQAPVLKMEENEGICGSSLELFAECQVDGEFTVLYTSNPKQFRVEVLEGETLIWQGFVTPELYSEPNVAPPYDVQIIATDGLGELKFHKFDLTGPHTLQVILRYILSYTGLTLNLSQITALSVASPSVVAAKDVLSTLTVDLTSMEGESCYDVLQGILASLHASLLCHRGEWVLVRETDVRVSSGKISGYSSAGLAKTFDVPVFGQMGVCDWWPVGSLSTAIMPATRSVLVKAENKYKTAVLDQGGWTYTGGARYDSALGGHYLPIQGATMRQQVVFSNYVDYSLSLIIRARNIGTGLYDAKLGVKVIKQYGSGSSAQTAYLSFREEGGSPTAQLEWTSQNKSVHAILSAPTYADGAATATEAEFVLPLYYLSDSNYEYASAVTVELSNLNGEYAQVVYAAGLRKQSELKGFQDTLIIDNGARDDARDVDMILTPAIQGNNQHGVEAFLCGLVMHGSQKVTGWSTSAFQSLDLLALMARDYALSGALPRAKVTGVLNRPAGQLAPLAFRDATLSYWLKTYDWNLYDDELTVELVSLPAASITVEEEEVTEVGTEGSTVSGGSSSGGGGGIAAGVTRVGLSTSAPGLVIGGSPVTASGDLTIGLENGYEIPQADRIVHNDGGANAVKKIVVVSSYPAVEESGTLYIKI